MAESLAANGRKADIHTQVEFQKMKVVRCCGDSGGPCDLAGRVSAVATALAELKVRREERVLILRPAGPGFMEAFLAAIHWAATPLPVNPELPAQEIMVIALDAGAQLVVASPTEILPLAKLATGPLVLVEGPDGPWAAALRLG